MEPVHHPWRPSRRQSRLPRPYPGVLDVFNTSVGDDLKLRVDPDHQRDWTVYIDGIALPFTDIVSGSPSGTGFTWRHPKLQDLYADWTDGDTYEIMIAEDPESERPDPPVTTAQTMISGECTGAGYACKPGSVSA